MSTAAKGRLLISVGVAGALSALGAAAVLYCYLAPVGFGERRDFAQLVAQIVGGAVVLFGLYSAWRQLLATEESQKIARDGQLTERFTRAIQQLGDSSVTIRLGGIYALERIAQDSERDHWTIIEVLVAFVEEKSRCEVEQVPDEPESVPRDVQAALTVVGRRIRTYEKERQHLRLSEVDLREVRLPDAHFEGIHFSFAHLDEAFLAGAHLEDALFDQVKMQRATLVDAHLERAVFIDVDLTNAWLERAHIDGTDLSGASGLTQAQIDSVASIDGDTKLPMGLVIPSKAK